MPVRFQVDPDFYDHPKVLGMSDAAVALWTRAGSYSAAKLTDGFIAEHVLPALSTVPQDAADELRRRGLWHRVKGGYRFHEWEARNLTRTRVESDRKADRERKRGTRGAAPKSAGQIGKPQEDTAFVRPESERSPNGIQPESERIPGVSVSVSVSESVSGSGRAVGVTHDPDLAALVGSPPEPPRTCRQHRLDTDPPPCGRCADARRENELWQADRRRRAAAAPDCPRHRGQPAHNCGSCRSEALAAKTGEFRIIQGGAAS